ncbi:MAG: PqqD family protein [Sphingomonas sp.]
MLHSALETETILLDTQYERYFSLKGAGIRFWALLRSDPSVDRAVAVLLEEFDIDEETLRRDLVRLWRDLSEQGLASAQQHDGTGHE